MGGEVYLIFYNNMMAYAGPDQAGETPRQVLFPNVFEVKINVGNSPTRNVARAEIAGLIPSVGLKIVWTGSNGLLLRAFGDFSPGDVQVIQMQNGRKVVTNVFPANPFRLLENSILFGIDGKGVFFVRQKNNEAYAQIGVTVDSQNKGMKLCFANRVTNPA